MCALRRLIVCVVASLTKIDRHYGHLARDGREDVNTRSSCSTPSNAPDFEPWTLVDAAWTANERNAASADNRTALESRLNSEAL